MPGLGPGEPDSRFDSDRYWLPCVCQALCQPQDSSQNKTTRHAGSVLPWDAAFLGRGWGGWGCRINK